MNTKLSAYSSPTNETLQEVIKNDTVRYIKKGYGFFVAALIVILYFTLGPPLMNKIYPYLIDGWDGRWFLFTSAMIVHTGLNLVFYLVFYFIYTAKIPFLEKYRVSQNPWPWESDPKEWKELFRDSVISFAINNFIVTPLLLGMDLYFSGVTPRISTESLPTIKDTILQFIFSMIVDDCMFYWTHRLLHHPTLYPYIHKFHHKYHHTVSIANEHAHPIEFILSGALSSTLGPKLLGKRMHITTLWLLSFMRTGESIDGHCGYEFPWSPYRLLPLSASATYHDFHHSENVGNYCSLFTFWDTFLKTNRDYWIWLSKHEKSELNKKNKGASQEKASSNHHQKDPIKPEIAPNHKAKKE